jgi:glycosyltransferase involved in cell wall biosynthesis
MSKHAQDALQAAGCSSHFVPIGSPPGYEPLEDSEIIKQYRNAMGVQDDEFMILTVADNQERKNLAAAFEIVASFSTKVVDYSEAGFATDTITKNKVKWVLVTRPDSPVGWDLNDLAMRMGIMDKISIVSRGIEDDMLIGLYQAADCFLLTSKAEGLAMPVLEAMATRTPVIGTNISAIAEHLGENDIDEARGYLLDVDFAFIDCYGNGERAMVSVDDGVNAMSMVYEDWQLKRYNDQNNGDYVDTLAAHEHMLNMAQEYVMSRTWGNAAAQFAEIIKQYTPPVLEIEPEPEIKEVAHG